MSQFLNHRLGHYTLLVVICLGAFFVNLGGPTLWEVDEGRNATAAYEMMEAGNWIIPTYNGELRVDKPALLYWLQIFAYWLFGVNEFSARLPSALAALATVLLVYELGRLLFHAAAGLLAGLILATSIMVCVAARFANPDALLNMSIVLAMFVFWRAYALKGSYAFVGCGIAMGLAVLAKGPVGLVLPCAVIGLFLLWCGKLHLLFHRRMILSGLVFVAVAGPWYILVGNETQGDFLTGFLGTHNVNRFLSTMENHRGGPFYYPLILLAGLIPWSVFLGVTIWYSFTSLFRPSHRWWTKTADQDIDTGGRRSDGAENSLNPADRYRFLWCWLGVFVLFFTLSATKLPNYVLPAAAPLALLTARTLQRWYLGRIHPARALMAIGLGLYGFVGLIAILTFLTIGGTISLPLKRVPHIAELAPWALVGLLPVAGALAGGWYLYRQRRLGVVHSVAASAVPFLVLILGWALPHFNSYKAPRPLVEQSGSLQRTREILIGCLSLKHLASLNFYCRRGVQHFDEDDDALAFLRHHVPVYLFVPETRWQTMKDRTTSAWRIVGVHHDLYRSTKIIVITNH